ncbi:pentatricopeptide repeat-containing protein At3g53170 [Elaeis guineensis]|uniref:Pentatricopeptide repeat-containing protein At3g53170 n=1 Tax=Elaeis guineensis var. tenera TaxID=51953 RepID=A0A6I9RWR1_ELAGV|nr:pentatricopeptide repeat-containing protein At3g53170 [Elaeis guineensis]XP_010933830.2 pentatricopeptide repeat-containing protein At3g53170 [Elaeis guineensis]XP_029123076.1 pentatricopeptide repeat-containing protein At3g53170 [Elaeis guineensis]
MELRFMGSADLLLSSSSSYRSKPTSNPFLETGKGRRKRPPVLLVRAAKRSSPSKGLQKEPKRALSGILRTEAAVLGVERKAGSGKSTNLWPRAVLEALDDSISNNRWESALKIFGLLRKQHWYEPKSQTYAKLLTMLGKCKQPEHATLLFSVMLSEGLRPTLDVYTSLVGAYGHSGLIDQAIHTIDEMKTISDCKPDVYTYTVLINCCSKLRCFDQIPALLAEMSYLRIECSIVTYNTIINGYGKAGMLEEMENYLSEMLESGNCLPDRFTMNSIMWAYGNSGRIDKMESWYEEFQHMGIEPDVQTFNILIKSYGKAGMHEKMGLVMKFMKKRFFPPDVVSFNLVIECFGRVGNIEKMEYFFRLMKIQGVKPNSITYCSVINGYRKAGLLDKVPAVIRQTENTDVVLDTPFFNCVISAYGQAGEVKIMEEMFLLMKEKNCKPDSITFATMIQAYNALGMDEAARELETKLHHTENKALAPG